MSVNFDIKLNCVNEFGHEVLTNNLNEIKSIISSRFYSRTTQLRSYSIYERTGEDITRARADLLGKIQIIFENKVPYDSQANDVYSRGEISPEKFLKAQADQLKNPKGWSTYLASFIRTSEYQAHVQRLYNSICASYEKLKAPVLES